MKLRAAQANVSPAASKVKLKKGMEDQDATHGQALGSPPGISARDRRVGGRIGGPADGRAVEWTDGRLGKRTNDRDNVLSPAVGDQKCQESGCHQNLHDQTLSAS